MTNISQFSDFATLAKKVDSCNFIARGLTESRRALELLSRMSPFEIQRQKNTVGRKDYYRIMRLVREYKNG